MTRTGLAIVESSLSRAVATAEPSRPVTSFALMDPRPQGELAVLDAFSADLARQLEVIKASDLGHPTHVRQRIPQDTFWGWLRQLWRAPVVVTLSHEALVTLDTTLAAQTSMTALTAAAVAVSERASEMLESMGTKRPIVPDVKAKLQQVAALQKTATTEQQRLAHALSLFTKLSGGYSSDYDKLAEVFATIPRERWAELTSVSQRLLTKMEVHGLEHFNALREPRALIVPPLPLPEDAVGEPAGEMSSAGLTRVGDELAFALYLRMTEKDRFFSRCNTLLERALAPERTDVERAVLGGVATFFKERMTTQSFVSFKLLDQLDLLERIGKAQPEDAIARAKPLLEVFERNGGRTFDASIERWAKKLDRVVPILKRESEKADREHAEFMRKIHASMNVVIF